MDLLNQVVNENAGLIWSMAKKFYGVSKEDLYQAGVVGIIKAYQNYKKDGETKFSTYACNYIYGEMYLVATNKEIKLSKDIIRLKKLIEEGKMKLTQELMRMPSNKELAEYLEMDEQKLEQVLMYASSLVSMDDETTEMRNLHEVLSKEEEICEDDRLLLNDSINSLNGLEKDIIQARYFEDLTQSETAKKLGVTQVMVSRYETRSLEKMRNYMYM